MICICVACEIEEARVSLANGITAQKKAAVLEKSTAEMFFSITVDLATTTHKAKQAKCSKDHK